MSTGHILLNSSEIELKNLMIQKARQLVRILNSLPNDSLRERVICMASAHYLQQQGLTVEASVKMHMDTLYYAHKLVQQDKTIFNGIEGDS